MIVVVSDTSPIVCLRFLQLEYLLADWFGEVLIPSEVANELASSAAGAIDVRQIAGLVVRNPLESASVQQHDARLDAGETAAIALARETKAGLRIVDEQVARRVATSLSIPVVGTLGLLVRAKTSTRVARLAPLRDRLRNDLGFFLSDSLYKHALQSVGESA